MLSLALSYRSLIIYKKIRLIILIIVSIRYGKKLSNPHVFGFVRGHHLVTSLTHGGVLPKPLRCALTISEQSRSNTRQKFETKSLPYSVLPSFVDVTVPFNTRTWQPQHCRALGETPPLTSLRRRFWRHRRAQWSLSHRWHAKSRTRGCYR